MHPAVSAVQAGLKAQGCLFQFRPRLLELLDGDEDGLAAAIAAFSQARVVVHFHPDRLTRQGRTVAQGLLDDGRYHSQFETGHSNGSLTAFAGGERDLWEEKLFDGTYQNVPEGSERPKYGAIEIFPFSDGPAPRFGSCYLVLRGKVARRCTFCVGDSHLGPSQIGTTEYPEYLLMGLMEQAHRGEDLMGRSLSPHALLNHLTEVWKGDRLPPSELPLGRSLDDYLEAQVHGPLCLETDVDTLVVDGSFRGTSTGEDIEAIAQRFGFPLHWRPAFELALEDVPEDFRGAMMPSLAQRVVPTGGVLTARAIGEGALSLETSPEAWADWSGNYQETWQQLKQLWHVLLAFGNLSDDID